MLSSLRQTIRADLYRLDAKEGTAALLRTLWQSPPFRYVVLLRACKHFRRVGLLRFSLYPFLLVWFSRLGRKYGIRIPLTCEIGDGLLIEHWGGIWVNPEVTIGRNCNIGHAVTVGWGGSGSSKGAPKLGDRVFLGPGCVVLGPVAIGSDALISANSVVLQDVPENGVVIGVPGRVFSKQGSHDVVKNVLGC